MNIPADLVQRSRNPQGVTVEEMERRVAQCSGFVKMMTGVANNAAVAIARDCHSKIADVRDAESYASRPRSPHPAYRQRVKQLFLNATVSELRRYRNGLMNPPAGSVCFFRLSDMPEQARRRYGDITDAQYFEFWEGTGAMAYTKSQPLVNSLHNKFRLSMEGHGVPHAGLVAWGLVGASVLELAVSVWQRAVSSVCEALDGLLSRRTLENIYGPFSLGRISVAWQRALTALAPETSGYLLDEIEERNVELGIEQLMELWMSADLPFDSTIGAVQDFSDVFASRGNVRKAVRELSDMRDSAVRDVSGE